MTNGTYPTIEGFCFRCEDRVDVYRTVDWQDDFCAECASTNVDISQHSA